MNQCSQTPHLCTPMQEGSTPLTSALPPTPHKGSISLTTHICVSAHMLTTSPSFVHANARGVDSSRLHRPPLCPCLCLPIHKGSCLSPLVCASVFTTSPIGCACQFKRYRLLTPTLPPLRPCFCTPTLEGSCAGWVSQAPPWCSQPCSKDRSRPV